MALVRCRSTRHFRDDGMMTVVLSGAVGHENVHPFHPRSARGAEGASHPEREARKEYRKIKWPFPPTTSPPRTGVGPYGCPDGWLTAPQYVAPKQKSNFSARRSWLALVWVSTRSPMKAHIIQALGNLH